jgi:hypothetical protein
MKKIAFTMLFLFFGVTAYGQVGVNFSVNMGVAMYNQTFDPATDTLTIRGDFQSYVNGGTDWSGFDIKMTRSSATDSIYYYYAVIDDSGKGKTFNFKYNINGVDAGYENLATNRSFTAPATTGLNLDLAPVYFSDNENRVGPPVKNMVKFVADLTAIYGSGAGFFDASKDSIEVKGLDWSGPYYVSGSKLLHQNSFTPTQYETDTIIVKGAPGDSTSWKFKAFPDLDFVNSGWEQLSDVYPTIQTNRWYHFVSDTSNLQTVTVVPAITPSQPPITKDVTLTFRIDMSGTISDFHNGYVIPYGDIQFVGLRSGLVGLGDWTSGNWNPSDTAGNQLHMRVLLDDGTNGDATAGDKVWSTSVVIASGTPGGDVDYKYGVYYGAANDTANGGTDIMDNEMAFGTNHKFTLTSNDLTITDNWGVVTAIERQNDAAIPVAYQLSQNYPNPFNPSTIIQYNLPNPGIVSLKIFDVLGREVITLVNEEQKAGVYKVSFDASKLSSGVYFYRIQSGSFVSTKKMMLLK